MPQISQNLALFSETPLYVIPKVTGPWRVGRKKFVIMSWRTSMTVARSAATTTGIVKSVRRSECRLGCRELIHFLLGTLPLLAAVAALIRGQLAGAARDLGGDLEEDLAKGSRVVLGVAHGVVYAH